MKREYQNGEMALLSKGKKMRGFTLPDGSAVKILKGKKIESKHGAWLYDIEVKHPITGELLVLEGWVTQYDLMTKEMAAKWKEQVELIRRLTEGLK